MGQLNPGLNPPQSCKLHVFVHLRQALLQNGLFHCCLVACSLDVAIVSTSFPCDVPLLLQIISLAPYHFLKVCFFTARVPHDLVDLSMRTISARQHLIAQLDKFRESLRNSPQSSSMSTSDSEDVMSLAGDRAVAALQSGRVQARVPALLPN